MGIVKIAAAAGSILDLGRIVAKAAKDKVFTTDEIDKICDAFGDVMLDVLDAVDFPQSIRMELGYRIKTIGEQLVEGKRF